MTFMCNVYVFQGERGIHGLNGTQGHQGCIGRRGVKVTMQCVLLLRPFWVLNVTFFAETMQHLPFAVHFFRVAEATEATMWVLS